MVERGIDELLPFSALHAAHGTCRLRRVRDHGGQQVDEFSRAHTGSVPPAHGEPDYRVGSVRAIDTVAPMDTHVSFRIADGVTWDRSDDQVVILNPDGSHMITLNAVGSILWPVLENPVGVDTLVSELHARFEEVDAETLRRDVLAFLDELGEEGLLTGSAG